jgi:molecular chaperone GrpE
LEIIDNLDRAIEAAKTDKQDNRSSAFLEGILLVRNQCLSTFSRYGVTPVLALGLSFDPNIHDALSMVPVTDPSKDNIVITVVKPGYFVNDDLLRPASVIVGKIPTQGE